MTRLYFDYNATTPLAPAILTQMSEWLGLFGNPNSVHAEGRKARQSIETARRNVARILGCHIDEIIFLSGATEANTSVFESVWTLRQTGRNEILVSSIEHAAIYKKAFDLEKRGAIIKQIPVTKEGKIDLDFIEKNLGPQTLLVSIMLANNETGFVLPVREIALLCRQKGVLMHTDAACAIGKTAFLFNELGVDFLSCCAHKFYGPKAMGALIIRKGTPFKPLMVGGAQERGYRAGTENAVAIMGLAEGLAFALEDLPREEVRLQKLRQILKSGLSEFIKNIEFIESRGVQLPGTLSCMIPEVNGQTFLAALDLAGVAASLGSACHSGALDVSRVILALGIPEEKAKGVLRLSFGKMTTQEEVEKLILIVRDVYKRMQ